MLTGFSKVFAVMALLGGIHPVLAEEVDFSVLQKIRDVIPVSVGVTRSGTPIAAFISQADLDIHVAKTRLLLVAGLDGSPHSTRTAINVMDRFCNEPQFESLRAGFTLSLLPCGNPDGLAHGLLNDNGSGGDPSRGYPPAGDAYTSPTNPESQYIWRWIGMHAPDIVIVMGDAKPDAAESVNRLVRSGGPEDGLSNQLQKSPPCNVGTIASYDFSLRVNENTPADQLGNELLRELNSPRFKAESTDDVNFSIARIELQLRDQRSPLQICRQLASVYGHELKTVAYIPAVACIGRLRLASLEEDQNAISDIETIAAEYLSGASPTLTDRSGGSEFAGHILWGELYDATKNPEYIRLVLNAADRAFSADGEMLEAVPTHSEMSDAVFMGCPMLAQAGRLTGDRKYFDMCVKHMRFMLKLNLRSDGLHRHSPLDETAWGRGNGFPALGLCLSLEDLPDDHPGREEMLDAFRDHLTALLPHQDPTGAWHQVIDHPESYRELSCTCMITYAMARGIRRGWLSEKTFDHAVEKGWKAIKARIASDGSLVDVCTGTGKQKSLREYLDRPAILGRDSRGGAMALLVATEMAAREE